MRVKPIVAVLAATAVTLSLLVAASVSRARAHGVVAYAATGAAALTDSLAMAPNDSTALARGAQAMIKKEQGGLGYRIRHSGLGDLYARGGIFMHPLLLSSIIGLVFIIERGWTLHRAKTDVRAFMVRVVKLLREQGVDGALEECERTRGPVAAIIHSGLMRANRGPDAVSKAIENAAAIEMAFLERGLIALSSVGNIAPLLGFLGTVSGMINAFAAIAAAEQVSAKIVAAGIEEALITTLAGLCIAIPVNAAHNYYVQLITNFATDMEEASGELANELMEMEHA